MSRFKQQLMALYYMAKTAPPDKLHDLSSPCNLRCAWISVDRWFLCTCSGRVHECGWFYCPCKWNQNGVVECGLTGHVFHVPGTAQSAKNKDLPGVMPAPLIKAPVMPQSDLVNGDILTMNLRARRSGAILQTSLDDTLRWLGDQPANLPPTAKDALAKAKKDAASQRKKLNGAASAASALTLVQIERQASAKVGLAPVQPPQDPALAGGSASVAGGAGDTIEESTNLITPFLPAQAPPALFFDTSSSGLSLHSIHAASHSSSSSSWY